MTTDKQPLYETTASGTRILRLYLLGSSVFVLALVVVGLILTPDRVTVWLLVAGCSAVPLALVWLVVPKRFEVWPDCLRLAFPNFGWDLHFISIDSVQRAQWWQSYAFRGLRFATSPSSAVVILRRSPRLVGRPTSSFRPPTETSFWRRCRGLWQTRRMKTGRLGRPSLRTRRNEWGIYFIRLTTPLSCRGVFGWAGPPGSTVAQLPFGMQ